MPGFILQRYLNYCDFNRIVSRDYTVFFGYRNLNRTCSWDYTVIFGLLQFEPYMQPGLYGDFWVIAIWTVHAVWILRWYSDYCCINRSGSLNITVIYRIIIILTVLQCLRVWYEYCYQRVCPLKWRRRMSIYDLSSFSQTADWTEGFINFVCSYIFRVFWNSRFTSTNPCFFTEIYWHRVRMMLQYIYWHIVRIELQDRCYSRIALRCRHGQCAGKTDHTFVSMMKGETGHVRKLFIL